MALWFDENYAGRGPLSACASTRSVCITARATTKRSMFSTRPSLAECWRSTGVYQTSVEDEYYYHEMLVHPAMLCVAHVRSACLIIGGGDGGSLREVLPSSRLWSRSPCASSTSRSCGCASNTWGSWSVPWDSDKPASFALATGSAFLREYSGRARST